MTPSFRSFSFLVIVGCVLLAGVPGRAGAQVLMYCPTYGYMPSGTAVTFGPDDNFPDGFTLELDQDPDDPSFTLSLPDGDTYIGSQTVGVSDWFSGEAVGDGIGNYYEGDTDYYTYCERFAIGQPASLAISISLPYIDEEDDYVSSSIEIDFIGPDISNDPSADCNDWGGVTEDEDDFSAEDGLISSLSGNITGDESYDASVLLGQSADETTAMAAYIFFYDGDQTFLDDLVGNGLLSFDDGLVQQAYSVANNDDQGQYVFFELFDGGMSWADLDSDDANALYSWAMNRGNFPGDDAAWGAVIYNLLYTSALSWDELDSESYNALTDYVQIEGLSDGSTVFNGLIYGILTWDALTDDQITALCAYKGWSEEYAEDYFDDYTPPNPPLDWIEANDYSNGQAVYYALLNGLLTYDCLATDQTTSLLDFTGWSEDAANDYFDDYTPPDSPDLSEDTIFYFTPWIDGADVEFDDDGNPIFAGGYASFPNYYLGPSANPVDFMVSPDGDILLSATLPQDTDAEIEIENVSPNYESVGEFYDYDEDSQPAAGYYVRDDDPDDDSFNDFVSADADTGYIYVDDQGVAWNNLYDPLVNPYGMENWQTDVYPTEEAEEGVNGIYYGDTIVGQFTVVSAPTFGVEVYNSFYDEYVDYAPQVMEVNGTNNNYISAWPGEDVTIWVRWDYGADSLSVATPADATLVEGPSGDSDDLYYYDDDDNLWWGWEFEFGDSVANQQDMVNVTESSGDDYYFDDDTVLYVEGWGSLPNGG